jgi:hypothetical protein
MKKPLPWLFLGALIFAVLFLCNYMSNFDPDILFWIAR